MAANKRTTEKVVFTHCPQEIVDEFLNRVDSAYHEADTICVITEVRPDSINQKIVKYNDELNFEYHLC